MPYLRLDLSFLFPPYSFFPFLDQGTKIPEKGRNEEELPEDRSPHLTRWGRPAYPRLAGLALSPFGLILSCNIHLSTNIPFLGVRSTMSQFKQKGSFFFLISQPFTRSHSEFHPFLRDHHHGLAIFP